MSLFQWTVLVLLLVALLLLAVVLVVAINARNMAKAAKEEAEQERLHHDSKPYATTNDILTGLEEMIPGLMSHIRQQAAINGVPVPAAVGTHPYSQPAITVLAQDNNTFEPVRSTPFPPDAPPFTTGYQEVSAPTFRQRDPRRSDTRREFPTAGHPGYRPTPPVVSDDRRSAVSVVAPISAPPAPQQIAGLDHQSPRVQLEERASRLRDGVLRAARIPAAAPAPQPANTPDRERRAWQRDPLGIHPTTDTTEFKLDEPPAAPSATADPGEATRHLIDSTMGWSLAFKAPSGEQPIVSTDGDAARGVARAPQNTDAVPPRPHQG